MSSSEPAGASRRRRTARRLLGVAAVLLAATGCGDGEPSAAGAQRLTVVTTVAPITSIVATIVGDRADIVGIVPEGADSHSFEPPPSVATALRRADVVFVNGLQLEAPIVRLAAGVGDGVPLVALGDLTLAPADHRYDFSFPESEGRPNPHLWTDPTAVTEYARIVRDTMVSIDPAGRDVYGRNFDAFAAVVDRFDRAARESLGTVPEANRKLVTYHDAYAYFADTYGWTVVGAIQPADFGEPTPAEVADLIDQIRRERVPAIFGAEVFPSPVLEQIAAETGAAYVDDLRDDDLPGEPGDAEHSWLGMMRFNLVTMTTALGGDASALEAFEVGDVVTDRAVYPQ